MGAGCFLEGLRVHVVEYSNGVLDNDTGRWKNVEILAQILPPDPLSEYGGVGGATHRT